MILVDTSVISELWRLGPDPRVLSWMDAQAIETLYLSAITVRGQWLYRGHGPRAWLMVATRDTSPFEAGGVPAINPWVAQR